jgi:hypothetical protein
MVGNPSEHAAPQLTSKSVRVTLFLSGRPSFGIGQIRDLPAEEQSQEGTNPFYKEEAKRAASAGICVDVIALKGSIEDNSFFGLPSLSHLCSSTGGNLLLYSLDTTSLAKDMYKRYSSPMAFQGTLRMRFPPEFEVNNAYGHLHEGPDSGSYLIQGCDPWKTFAFDFKFFAPNGFEYSARQNTFLQLAFAHAYLPGAQEGVDRVIVRKLRVLTLSITRSYSYPALYSRADADSMILILYHQVSVQSTASGWELSSLLEVEQCPSEEGYCGSSHPLGGLADHSSHPIQPEDHLSHSWEQVQAGGASTSSKQHQLDLRPRPEPFLHSPARLWPSQVAPPLC